MSSAEATYGLPAPSVTPPEAPAGGYLPSTLARLRDAAQALLPPGRAFTRRPGAVLTAVVEALVMELARVHLSVQTLLANVSPRRARDPAYLAQWEEAAGIDSPTGDLAARSAAVAARIRGIRPFDLSAYKAIATEYGYSMPGSLKGEAPLFRAGQGRAGDPVPGVQWASVFVADLLGLNDDAQLRALEAAWSARVKRAHTIVRARVGSGATYLFFGSDPVFIGGDRVVL